MRDRPQTAAKSIQFRAVLLTLISSVVIIAVHQRNQADSTFAAAQAQHPSVSFNSSSQSRRAAAAAPDTTKRTRTSLEGNDLDEIGPFETDEVAAAQQSKDGAPQPKVVIDDGKFNSDEQEDEQPPFPRVALLFLSRGPMPHEPSWRLFFQAAASLTRGWPAPRNVSRHVVPGQQLFSAYLHTAPGFRSKASSTFATLQLEDPVQVQWGQHSVAEAERRLIITALHDRANRRFLLLSESCVFLYPPSVVYLEAFAETRSRINACLNPADPHDENRRQVHRFQRDMHTDRLNASMWRKSSQWITLNRKHAALVASDVTVDPLFVRECWVDTVNRPPTRFCVSDEHYIPTLLAAMGLENETDCVGGATLAIWHHTNNPAPAHPKTWAAPYEVTASLIDELRVPGYAKAGCNFTDAIRTAEAVFALRAGQTAVQQRRGSLHDYLRSVMQQMPQKVKDMFGAGTSTLMRRHLLATVDHLGTAAAGVSRGHARHAHGLLSADPGLLVGGRDLQQHVLSAERNARQRALAEAAVGADTGPKPPSQAWQGESWFLDDAFAEEDIEGEVRTLLGSYAALGEACPLFARKFAATVVNEIRIVSQQHILAASHSQ